MKTSRILILASIILLILSATARSPEKSDIGSLDAGDIGKRVSISGTVDSFSRSNKTSFFNVSDSSGEITVVSFNSQKIFSRGEKISAVGRVTLYHGKLEIVVEKSSRRPAE